MPRGRRVPLAIPTTEPLPHNLRLPSSSPEAFKTLSRLSRPVLLSLAVQWCQDENLETCAPYIVGGDVEQEDEDPEAPYTAAHSVEEVRELYEDELPRRKGTKREVVDRILEGDWRHGISLKQLAMAETRYILEHANALRWTAFRFARAGASDTESEEDGKGTARKRSFALPRFHSQIFLLNLQHNIAPLAKAHYYVERASSRPLTLVRVYLQDTPYNTQRSFSAACSSSSPDGSKSIFLAFPDATPFVYIALTSSGPHPLLSAESKSIQRFVVDAIPKSISTPDTRYELRGTSLTARSLDALLSLRGNGRTNAAAGGWSIFAADASASRVAAEKQPERQRHDDNQGRDADQKPQHSTDALSRQPLDFRDALSPTPEPEDNPDPPSKRAFAHAHHHHPARKRQRLERVACARFGASARSDDGLGIQRLDVRLEDPFASPALPPRDDADDATWTPSVRLSFQGTHIFAGIRALVEAGVLDGRRVPGWMTGEAGVSVGTVRGGRIEAAGDADEL